MNRRAILLGAGSVLVAGSRPAFAVSSENLFRRIRIVLSPTCGCCKHWVTHLQTSGFETAVEEVAEINRRKVAARIPTELWSCHTAFIDSYFIEGHVLAVDIDRLLAERPQARGLAVPGMPVGSPGMEMPDVPSDRFKTLLVGPDNRATVWAEH
jgi:hypothetical protein